MKKLVVSVGIVLAAAGLFGVANATEVSAMGRFASSDKSVYIKPSETIDGALYAVGESVIVEGTVNGDVYCGGSTVEIRATVKGDVNCAGQKVTVAGDIDGSVRLAGETINLRGKIGRNATLMGSDVLVESSATIAGDLNGGAANVQLSGDVGRDVAMGASNLVIAANVGRDVQGDYSEELTIASDATIGGRVHVSAPAVNNIGKVAGGIQREDPSKNRSSLDGIGGAIGFLVMMTLGLIVTSMALMWLMPRFFANAVALRKNDPLKAAVIGFVTLTFLPSVALMFAISGIGIPLAVIIILVWMLLLFVSGPVAAYLLGTLIMRRRKSGAMLTMFVGSLVLVLLYLVPLVNIIVIMVSMMLGAGMTLLTLYKQKVFAR